MRAYGHKRAHRHTGAYMFIDAHECMDACKYIDAYGQMEADRSMNASWHVSVFFVSLRFPLQGGEGGPSNAILGTRGEGVGREGGFGELFRSDAFGLVFGTSVHFQSTIKESEACQR